jgi:hypothetical protein
MIGWTKRGWINNLGLGAWVELKEAVARPKLQRLERPWRDQRITNS